jgi:D-tyrosyl-tRNA(Tyr) deacylase
MRLLLQRVNWAEVTVENRSAGKIGRGLLIFCGFKKNDSASSISRFADKCLNLRIFEDDAHKMNLSALDIAGEILVVSQFTLCADCRRGRRPAFDNSMPPEQAEQFYRLFIDDLRKSGLRVEEGVFGAKMEVSLLNYGPVTIMLDDDDVPKS